MYHTRQESRTHFRVHYDAQGHKLFYRKTCDGKWIHVSREVFGVLRSSVRREEYAQEVEQNLGIIPLPALDNESSNLNVFLCAVASPEEIFLSTEEKSRLKYQINMVIDSFPISDQALIWEVIVNGVKPSDYAARIGVHRGTVSRRKKQLLIALRDKLRNINESYKKGTL